MKAQFLKIAGVKNEQEFYKKFPTEESFFKKHGKQLQTAQNGADINGNGIPDEQEGLTRNSNFFLGSISSNNLYSPSPVCFEGSTYFPTGIDLS